MNKFSAFSALFLAKIAFGDQSVILPSACNDLPDGDHWLKIIEGDDFPPVRVQCSNGFIMLDVNNNPNLEKYFSSWAKWHYAIAGPTNDDHTDWSGWFLGDDGSTEYLISPSCDVCDASDLETNELGTDTTYYMTGNLYGCWWWLRGLHDCDMDWDTYECFACECLDGACHGASLTDSDSMTGICASHKRSSTAQVALTHDACTRDTGFSYKPSLGTDGRFCACAKPSSTQYYEIDAELVNEATDDNDDEDEGSIDDLYELYQTDFEVGTYRIMKPGTYKIMEDIIFDFNAGHSNEEGAWMPHDDQADDYPGAGQYRDPYFLGFFAGITVETHDVIIDLNGFTLKQSQQYYYQQRWFSIIELANQPFMPGQGPGFFGGEPKPADGVEIKNGILGLSSHHGIHGNRCKNINIHDVIVKDFETHGIQINGFTNVEIRDVEVGPASQQAFLLGEYGHARMLLPRLRKIADENPTEAIKFYDREFPLTIAEIADDMEMQINMAWNYVMYGTTYDEDDVEYETWLSAKSLYINEDGIPYGSGMYGIFFSYPGANVFGYAHSNLKSVNAVVENVKIHGMRHKMGEYLRFHSGIPFYVNPFNAVFDVEAAMSDVTDKEGSHYVGNLMTDAYLAMNKISDNWGYLQMQMLKNDGLVAWAVGHSPLDDDITITCNADVMTHSGKGLTGFRLDGVTGVEVSNMEIYDIYDYSPVGSLKCGEYEAGGGNIQGGHFLQKRPMQMGFSGNMVQGISFDYCEVDVTEINVHDIGSGSGLAYGISVWPGTDMDIKGNVKIKNVKAGFQIDTGTYTFDDRPNKAPEACGMRIYWQYNKDTAAVTHSNGMIQSTCVRGHVGCFDEEDFEGSMLGRYESCDDSINDIFLTGTFDKSALSQKDTTNDLPSFNTRDSPMSPIDSELKFGKLVTFHDIAQSQDIDTAYSDSAPKRSDAGLFSLHSETVHKSASLKNDINKKDLTSTNMTHFALLIIPIIAIVFYAIYSKCIYDKTREQNMKAYQYTKVPVVERANYGSL